MEAPTHYPLLMFALTFPAMWLAALAGLALRHRLDHAGYKRDEDFDLVVTATLTLLGLIIGFTFSMATSRYDQRKNLEAAEANTIGTEYRRLDLLPSADAAPVRALLVAYLDERIVAYTTTEARQRAQTDQKTLQLQDALWSGVRTPAAAQPTPAMALVLAGMNAVIDSQGYSQAAILNRIPGPAWLLMLAIALCSSALLGFGSRSSRLQGSLGLVLPFVAAISFLLIADIDEPAHGLIQVEPDNLISLSQTLHR